MRTWLGASSRVALPERKTESSLLKVSSLSALTYMSPALPRSIACSASSSWLQWPPGKLPLVTVIAEAIAPPTKKPLEKGWRMLRDS